MKQQLPTVNETSKTTGSVGCLWLPVVFGCAVAQPCALSLGPASCWLVSISPTMLRDAGGSAAICSFMAPSCHDETATCTGKGFPTPPPQSTSYPHLLTPVPFGAAWSLHSSHCQQKPSLPKEGISCLRRQFFH